MRSQLLAFSCVLLSTLGVSAEGQGELACSYIRGIVNACASGISNFAQLPFTSAASCLCYESTVWNPDNYDQAFRTCDYYIETESPVDYATLTAVAGGPLPTAPCRDAGNVRNYPEKDPNLLACSQIGNVVAGCAATYPGFIATAAFVDQAPCLCYRNGDPSSYIGPQYDTIAASCLVYYSKASPVAYSSALASNGGKVPDPPCQAVKDAYTSSPSISRTPATTPPAPGSFPSPAIVSPTFSGLMTSTSSGSSKPFLRSSTSSSERSPSESIEPDTRAGGASTSAPAAFVPITTSVSGARTTIFRSRYLGLVFVVAALFV
ncbi:hypothetical protein BKA65DRAFT_8522 [Rhexocercosporidium sp. MPI-PUGE-AT-0058]|nr:hypothetical protein BKA65DRAFT_8522 [Rhexocercosporidium sp. MPI-PUGE-AT-0058]